MAMQKEMEQTPRWHRERKKTERGKEISNLNPKFSIWKSGRIIITSIETGKSTGRVSTGTRKIFTWCVRGTGETETSVEMERYSRLVKCRSEIHRSAVGRPKNDSDISERMGKRRIQWGIKPWGTPMVRKWYKSVKQTKKSQGSPSSKKDRVATTVDYDNLGRVLEKGCHLFYQ